MKRASLTCDAKLGCAWLSGLVVCVLYAGAAGAASSAAAGSLETPKAPAVAVATDTAPTEPTEEVVYVAPTRLDRIGRIMAPVFINGQGPYAFVVDTGASRSVIAPRVAAALGLRPDPARRLELRGVTGAESVPSVYVESLKAGEIVLNRQLLPVVTPSVFADADGILGVEGFARTCLHADFIAREISIRRNGCPRTSGNWARAKASFRFGSLLTVNARTRGTKLQAVIDTGAERSLGNLALLRALKLEHRAEDPTTVTSVFGATSHQAHGFLIATPTIHLGDMEIGDLKVTYGNFDVFRLWDLESVPAIVIGMDVLGTVDALMIDYRRAELRVLPRGASDIIDMRRGNPGRLP